MITQYSTENLQRTSTVRIVRIVIVEYTDLGTKHHSYCYCSIYNLNAYKDFFLADTFIALQNIGCTKRNGAMSSAYILLHYRKIKIDLLLTGKHTLACYKVQMIDRDVCGELCGEIWQLLHPSCWENSKILKNDPP